MTTRADEAVALSFEQSWGRLVAGLIGWCGDWDLAEECAQEAYATAVVAWARDGVPVAPLAWLTTVARNRARDRMRRRTTEDAKLGLAHADATDQVAAVASSSGSRSVATTFSATVTARGANSVPACSLLRTRRTLVSRTGCRRPNAKARTADAV